MFRKPFTHTFSALFYQHWIRSLHIENAIGFGLLNFFFYSFFLRTLQCLLKRLLLQSEMEIVYFRFKSNKIYINICSHFETIRADTIFQ